MRLGEILIERGRSPGRPGPRARTAEGARRQARQDPGRHGLHRHARRAGRAVRSAGRSAGHDRRAARGLPRNRRALAALPAPVPLRSRSPSHDHTLTLAMADPLDFETIAAVRAFTRPRRCAPRSPPSRKSSTPSTSTTAKPSAQTVAEGDDDEASAGSRTPARHGERGAGHPPGERHDRAGRREARQRHPHRAVREGIPHPLPHRRRAVQSGDAAARAEGRHHLAPEADGQAEHRRAPPAAGRPHQDQDRWAAKSISAFPRCPRSTAKASSCACSTAPPAISTTCAGSASTTTCWRAWSTSLSLPHGIFLVTGPTGSGKSTTLYSALKRINLPDKKIITIEDPVEYQMDGINQIHVNPQIGLTFAAGPAPHRAPGSRRHHGRRNPRPRNRRHRHPRRAHRPPRLLHAAHQRRAQRHHAPDRHGRRELPDHVVAGGGAGAAPGARDLPALQAVRRARASRPTARRSQTFRGAGCERLHRHAATPAASASSR